MMTSIDAQQFAAEWVDSWNTHDLDRILSHYEDDFEMSSPVIARLVNESTGKLKHKERIREYWTKALAADPNLRFMLQDVLLGANSVVVIYHGVRGSSAETFVFRDSGKVSRAFAHYLP